MTLEQSMKMMIVTHPDYQATLDEILAAFSGHTIYGLDHNEYVCIVDSLGNVYATFESIGYEEDDGTPDVYQLYDMNYDNVKFAEVAHLWADTITKLQGGTK